MEARRALQALFVASGPRTPLDRSESIAGERSSAREQAGIALRELFKSDIRKALRAPVAADTWKEVEKQVFKSLDQMTPLGSFKPPPRQPNVNRKSAVESVEVQTVAMPLPPREIQEPAYEPPKQPYEPPRMRRCVELEHRDIVGPLRIRVQDARSRLASLDGEVTRLTKALKKSRMGVWESQRTHCFLEKEVDRILEERTNEIPEAERAEFAKVIVDEVLCQAEFKVAREKGKVVKQRVGHQDKMLQEEREASKGEVHRILQRHPCGEVFLLPMSAIDSDDDSDDDYSRYGRGPASRGPPGKDDRVQLGSSSDEDDEGTSTRRPPVGGGGASPPPPPSQSFRTTTHKDSDESEASNATSPSSSGGGPSPSHGRSMSTPKLRDAVSDSSYSSDDGPEKLSAGRALNRAVKEKQKETSTDSDEDNKRATVSPKQGEQNPARQGTSVPPLPTLSNLSRDHDEVQEVSSEMEEDWEEDVGGSSRSV